MDARTPLAAWTGPGRASSLLAAESEAGVLVSREDKSQTRVVAPGARADAFWDRKCDGDSARLDGPWPWVHRTCVLGVATCSPGTATMLPWAWPRISEAVSSQVDAVGEKVADAVVARQPSPWLTNPNLLRLQAAAGAREVCPPPPVMLSGGQPSVPFDGPACEWRVPSFRPSGQGDSGESAGVAEN